MTLGNADLLLSDGWVPVDEWAMLCFVKDGGWVAMALATIKCLPQRRGVPVNGVDPSCPDLIQCLDMI